MRNVGKKLQHRNVQDEVPSRPFANAAFLSFKPDEARNRVGDVDWPPPGTTCGHTIFAVYSKSTVKESRAFQSS